MLSKRMPLPQAVAAKSLPHKLILGVPVAVTTMSEAVDTIGRWIAGRESRYVCASDVHSIMRAQETASHMEALNAADMVVPDGMPVVWASRLYGAAKAQRVCGPDLMLAVCERSLTTGWTHYFYGGAEGVAEALAEKLRTRYPGLKVVGTECPPFRPLTDGETQAALQRINDAAPDIVWIGLGCPKQEAWMLKHRPDLPGKTLVGVGAAFDFHTDRVKRAPVWMQNSGLEWAHRLASEPRRLWRRYLLQAPRFVFASLREWISGSART